MIRLQAVVLTEHELHLLLRSTELLNLAVMMTAAAPFPARSTESEGEALRILRNKVVVAYGRITAENAIAATWPSPPTFITPDRGVHPRHPVPGTDEREIPAGPGTAGVAGEISR